MSYSYRLDGAKGLVIDASGEIVQAEKEIFRAWLVRVFDPISKKTGRSPLGIVLNSSGGSVEGAADMFDAIEWINAEYAKQGKPVLNTGVAWGGTCASACVLVWAAGAQKSAAPDSRVGVHQVTNQSAAEGNPAGLASAEGYTKAFAGIMKDKGAPATVVSGILLSPPSAMYWLTPSDMAAWNVRVTW
jgi:hypothetical protein